MNAAYLIVPIHNPGAWWLRWVAKVAEQRPKLPGVIVDSSSSDGSDFSILPEGWKYHRIPALDFNHGGTRNLALQKVPPAADIVVFMTQDALLAGPQSVEKLVAVFADPAVACAYGRQLPHTDATPVAAHARLFNYPDAPHAVGMADVSRLHLKACFMSNSFAAYRLSDLLAVGGFPSDVILGEDMAVAARLLMAGKRVAYMADACVFHSHNYTVMQEFRRYFDTGVFHARSPWLLQTFGGATGEGLRFVRSELAYLWRHAPFCIPSAMVRTVAKWLGYRLGRAERLLPLWCKPWLSMHKAYWQQQGAH